MTLSSIPAHGALVIARLSVSFTIDKTGFSNAGTMMVNNGALSLSFPTIGAIITNSGLMKAGPHGVFTLACFRGYETFFGTLANSGTIQADGGTVVINAKFHQTATGTVKITNNGTVELDARSDGGTIQITAGTLAFGGFGRAPVPFGSQTTATIQFLGKTGTLDFARSDITETFNPATRELLIRDFAHPYKLLADLHLGGPTVYSAADFSVHGSHVLFAHP